LVHEQVDLGSGPKGAVQWWRAGIPDRDTLAREE
jgi:hypothetical protein